MAILSSDLKEQIVQLGNRNDACYLCTNAITAKDEKEFRAKKAELKGKLEGTKVVKIFRSGTETILCMDCIHKIAAENPVTPEGE